MRKLALLFNLLLCLCFLQLSAHERHYSPIKQKQQEAKIYLNPEGLFFKDGKIYLDTEGNAVQKIDSIFSDANGIYTSVKKEKSQDQASPRGFKVFPQELIFDGENILISRDGEAYLVTALEREGNQWLASLTPLARYCPRGHNSCYQCGSCHYSNCPFYTPPCWK